MKNIAAAVLTLAASFGASAAPYHHDTAEHICVEVGYDYHNRREYCSVYEARYPLRSAPTYFHQPRPVYYYPPGVSVNIRHRGWGIQYHAPSRPQPVYRGERRYDRRGR